jgi:hypothetical protein
MSPYLSLAMKAAILAAVVTLGELVGVSSCFTVLAVILWLLWLNKDDVQ